MPPSWQIPVQSLYSVLFALKIVSSLVSSPNYAALPPPPLASYRPPVSCGKNSLARFQIVSRRRSVTFVFPPPRERAGASQRGLTASLHQQGWRSLLPRFCLSASVLADLLAQPVSIDYGFTSQREDYSSSPGNATGWAQSCGAMTVDVTPFHLGFHFLQK